MAALYNFSVITLIHCRYNSTGIDPYGRGGAMGGAFSAEEIRRNQQHIIAEQDEGLEHLSKALRNQQRMGEAMQDEIQDHNGIVAHL